ncbi:MAG: hypothetical protein ACXW2X_03320 [Thermoanaerobaculia bacterium]
MSAMIHTFESQLTRKYRALLTPASVLAFWAAAAFLVIVADHTFNEMSVPLCIAMKGAAILATGLVYMRLSARDATVDHALIVGVVWLVLGIVAEVVMAENTRHGWYSLLGSPAHPLWRDVLLFAWVAAPAIFARRRS